MILELKGNIGLIDNDLIKRRSQNFPNLALMKISSYLKSKGNDVELTNFESIGSLFDYDYIILSKVFTDTITPDGIIGKKNVIYGGTGFFYEKAEKLPVEIEHIMPDYNLYKNAKHIYNAGKSGYYLDHSIGFTTRGCIRQCPFCVNKNSKKVEKHSDLLEFYDEKRKYITLLDDNITAYSGFFDVWAELKQTNKPFTFKQGMDFRLLTEKKIKVMADTPKYGKTGKIGQSTYYFAFDNIKDKDVIVKKLEVWNSLMKRSIATWFYVLTGFDFENKYDYSFYENDYLTTIERIKILYDNRTRPYLMLHENVKKSPFYDKILVLKQFCNSPIHCTNRTLEDYIKWKNIDVKFENKEYDFCYKY
jgi:hypothetical protein